MLLIQLSLLFKEYCSSSLDVKRLELETNYPSPTIAGIKNVWSCNYIPPCAFMACSGTTLPLS